MVLCTLMPFGQNLSLVSANFQIQDLNSLTICKAHVTPVHRASNLFPFDSVPQNHLKLFIALISVTSATPKGAHWRLLCSLYFASSSRLLTQVFSRDMNQANSLPLFAAVLLDSVMFCGILYSKRSWHMQLYAAGSGVVGGIANRNSAAWAGGSGPGIKTQRFWRNRYPKKTKPANAANGFIPFTTLHMKGRSHLANTWE